MNSPEEYAERYRSNLEELVKELSDMEEMVFNKVINLAMSNEFTEIDQTFEVGDEFKFEIAHFEDSTDTNVNLLMTLLKYISETKESIANINALDLEADDENGENDDDNATEINKDDPYTHQLNTKQRMVCDLINHILWVVWDPLGISESEDTSDAYKPISREVFKLKEDKADADTIAGCLYDEEIKALGEYASYPNCLKCAQLICAI